MSGVITLTTDFGHKGPFAAVMRGVILARAPRTHIIDLTHEIHVHWPAEAGFWLARAFQYFPAGTVHIAVVDPGVGTSRAILAAKHQGHVFLAPDNGLLAQMLEDNQQAQVYRLDENWRRKQDWPTPSQTFHGRDIFAPLAADLASGRTAPEDIGPITTDIVPSLLEPAEVDGQTVKGCVVTLDNFGNLITNIDASLVSNFASARVQAAGRSLPLLDTYGQTKPGEFLALINSFGVLELACAEGNAADRLGLGRGAPVLVNGQTKN